MDKIEKAKNLWERYYMLSGELLKFIEKDDIENFILIVGQRQNLLEEIEALPDDEFRETDECREIFEKIKPLDMQALYKAKSWLNKSRRNNKMVKGYDTSATVGRVFNRQL